MTTESLDAVFEHGSFRLLGQSGLALRDGQQVRIVVQTEETQESPLALATSVYEGLSPQEITAIESIALQRREFFGESA